MKTHKIIALLLMAAMPCVAKNKPRTIVNIQPIEVQTPEHCAPRLPWQMLVTYSDGTQEWRQVRWEGSDTAAEAWQSSAPLGSEYKMKGWILGDPTTPQGYPVTANISVTANQWQVPTTAPIVRPMPLTAVKLTGNNRLTSNCDRDIEHLLSLDVTKMLWNYRDTYGLPTDGYAKPDGWDSPDTKLKGHGTGHYLSAIALAYTAAQQAEQRQALYERIERMVKEMRQCQERTFTWSDSLGRYIEARDYAPEQELIQMKASWQDFDLYKKDYSHYGYGYINAIPAAHPAMVECYIPYNNVTGLWAPYYTIHKQLAGLIEIVYALQAETDTAKIKTRQTALQIATDMGLWVWNRLHYRTYLKTEGTKDQLRAKPGNRREMWDMYIAGEVGGMAESLLRLAEMATNKDNRQHLVEAATYFDAPAFFNPIACGIDNIRNRHANQHIPMIIGALRQYTNGGSEFYYNLATNFWNLLQGRYSYATGGVGHEEVWGEPYTQMAHMVKNPVINETCCAYNLAKLTRDLNCYNPENAAYMDYYERLLCNQIVGSLSPDHWAVTYHYAIGTKAQKPFGNETPQVSCCGGTGVENHVKYPEAAYYTNENTIYIGLYMPTEVVWEQKDIMIKQECKWPADRSTITFSSTEEKSKPFEIKLRVPYWAKSGFDIKVNGKSVTKRYEPSTYITIPARQWTKKDRIEVIMPFQPHICWGADKVDGEWVGTLMYGPLAMATEDIDDWDSTIIEIAADLSNLRLQGSTNDDGINGNIFSLQLEHNEKNIKFTPDYYQTKASTHYIKMRIK